MNIDDRVRCIDNYGTDFKLTEGRSYTIENIDYYTGFLFLKEVQGAWSTTRFVLVTDCAFSLDDAD